MSSARFGLALFAVASLVQCSSPGDQAQLECDGQAWASFGHDLANTRRACETQIGPGNVGRLVERWRWPAGDVVGPGNTSTTSVVDGVAYFGAWDGRVVAADAQTGDVFWENAPVGAGAFDSSPAATAERVYASDASGYVYAFSRDDGTQIWRTRLEPEVSLTHLWSSPIPVPDENLVIIGVASLDVLGFFDESNFRGSVVGLDADTGDIRWQRYLTGDDETSGAGVSVWSTAAVDRELNLLFVGTAQNVEPPASPYSDSLVAIDYTNGSIRWYRQFTADDVYTIFGPIQGPDHDVGASPNLFEIDGRKVVGVADKGGVYSTLDRETGETVWARELTEGSHLGGVMSTAAHDGQTIYVVSNRMENTGNYNSAVNDAVVFALNATNGTSRWETEIPSAVFGAVTLANDVVYVGTVNGEVFGLDARNGEVQWEVTGLADIGGGVSVSDGFVYVPHGFVFIGLASDAAGGLIAYGLP